MHIHNQKVDKVVITPVAQLVKHRMYYSKVTGSVPAGGKLSFHPFHFLAPYIIISANDIPCTVFGMIVC